MSEVQRRFVALGREQRDCPICFRFGTLTGDRVAGAELSCIECAARFSYAIATTTEPAMLTRLPNFATPVSYREPLVVFCDRCLRKHCTCNKNSEVDPPDSRGYFRR